MGRRSLFLRFGFGPGVQYSVLWRPCEFIPDFGLYSDFLLHQNDYWATTHAATTGNAEYENHHVPDALDDVVFL